MLYQATHNTYDSTNGPGTGETRVFGSKRAAKQWATEVLKKHPVVTTNDLYWRDVGRAHSVSVYQSIRFISEYMHSQGQPKEYRSIGWPVFMIDPPVYIHTSVGELGYTP